MNSKIFWKIIGEHKNIGIFFKNNPTADLLGAALALKNILSKIDKNVQIIGDRGKKLKWFDLSEEFSKWWKLDGEPELAIVIGCSEKLKVSCHQELINFKRKLIISNTSTEEWGDIRICEPLLSICEIIHNFMKENNWKLDDKIATYLLLGVYNNSSAFLNENIGPETFKIAHELMEYKPEMEKIIKTFKNGSYIYEKLAGDILSKSQLRNDFILILNITTQQVYQHMPHMFGKLNDARNQSEVIRLTGRFKMLSEIKIIISVFFDIFNPNNPRNKLLVIDCLEPSYINPLLEMGFTNENDAIFLRGKMTKYCTVPQARETINRIIATFQ